MADIRQLLDIQQLMSLVPMKWMRSFMPNGLNGTVSFGVLQPCLGVCVSSIVEMRYWLMKSEPETYSIDDLQRDGVGEWEGVRNYQARNFMRDDMRLGDRVLFYHSNASPSGVAGIAQVTGESRPDYYSWNPESPYYDPKSTPDAPRWFMVEVGFVEKFPHVVPLALLKRQSELEQMTLLNRSRLSVQPVEKDEFTFICRLAKSLGN